MNHLLTGFWAFILAFLSACAPTETFDSATAGLDTASGNGWEVSEKSISVPSGFSSISTGTGVTIYYKAYSAGYPDYVTVVDLTKASVRHLAGSVASGTSGTSGAYISKSTGDNWWTTASGYATSSKPLMALVNATFFSGTTTSSSLIAFGLKASSTTLSPGYCGGSCYSGYEQVFKLNSSSSAVGIANYSSSVFSGSDPDMVGALDPRANKSSTSWVQRTFAGIRDDNGDGTAEYLLLYSSYYATQAWAESILTSFGASDMVMFDGGGSTYYAYRSSTGTFTNPIDYSRKVPDVLAVYSGR